MTEANLRKTPLYDSHINLGGKMIEFAGWELPVYYDGIIEEHTAVRECAGIFDVSHMGEIEIKGDDAQDFVYHIITNDSSTLCDNQVMYSPMCYENGGIVDDILVYKYNKKHFLLVVNASNIPKDIDWLFNQKCSYKIEIDNVSDDTSQIAIQGPKAEMILQKLTSFGLSDIKFFFFQENVMINNSKCMVSRTGYTGEDGFEIYAKNADARSIFDKLIEVGKDSGLKPVGLGCRDTLRFEATLPLYGNEITQDISPLEAGLGMFVKLSKDNFIGKATLQSQKDIGLKRNTVGFEMIDKSIPRHGYEVYADGEKIGFVTTGYMSPTLKKNIGLALIDSQYKEIGTNIEIMIRNKFYKAVVISKNFYNKKYKK